MIHHLRHRGTRSCVSGSKPGGRDSVIVFPVYPRLQTCRQSALTSVQEAIAGELTGHPSGRLVVLLRQSVHQLPHSADQPISHRRPFG
jgi:hypothetical protein